MATRKTRTTKTAPAAAAAVEVQTPAAETPVKTTRKAPVKKAAAPKITLTVQYMGKEMSQEEMVAAVQKKCQDVEIQSLELYVKPEDHTVYYVVNGDTTGQIAL